jgi:hypothetical protein
MTELIITAIYLLIGCSFWVFCTRKLAQSRAQNRTNFISKIFNEDFQSSIDPRITFSAIIWPTMLIIGLAYLLGLLLKKIAYFGITSQSQKSN